MWDVILNSQCDSFYLGKLTIGLSGYNLVRNNPQHRSYSFIRNIYDPFPGSYMYDPLHPSLEQLIRCWLFRSHCTWVIIQFSKTKLILTLMKLVPFKMALKIFAMLWQVCGLQLFLLFLLTTNQDSFSEFTDLKSFNNYAITWQGSYPVKILFR